MAKKINAFIAKLIEIIPITEAEAAHDILYRGENVGKVVLTVG